MMNQMDADIMSAFVDSGLADVGSYVFDSVTTPVQCLVDLEAVTAGDHGGLGGTQIEITLFLADVNPTRGAKVIVGSSAYELVKRERRDQSREVWSAHRAVT